jgi:MtN3 and saliva related transmembrane protein
VLHDPRLCAAGAQDFIVETWRTRATADISLGMFALMAVGNVFWLIYGLLIEDLPLILANAVTLSLAGTILVLKLRHG